MNYRKSIIGLFLLQLIACETTSHPEPKRPQEPMPSAEWCDRAQAHLEELKCKEAFTKKGRSFAAICKENANQSPGINLFPECLSAIQTCDEVSACR